VLSSKEGAFHDLASLMECLKASCFLPGLAGGRPVEVSRRCCGGSRGGEIRESDTAESELASARRGGGGREASTWNDSQRGLVTPMVDALIYEPIPYRSAVNDGCTHVLVLRTWPDQVRPCKLRAVLACASVSGRPHCLNASPFPQILLLSQLPLHSPSALTCNCMHARRRRCRRVSCASSRGWLCRSACRTFRGSCGFYSRMATRGYMPKTSSTLMR